MAQADDFRKPVSLLGGGRKTQFDELLLRIVDGGLAGCIFVVPLLMGGRQALGQLALVSLAVAVALSWSLYRSLQESAHWRFSTALLLPLAAVALLVLQTAPLGESALTQLSPRIAELLPLWVASADAPGNLGAWSTVSLTPAATKAGMTLLLAYTLLFLVTMQRIRRIDDVERLLRWIALSTLLMAAFGLLQLLASNGKFFWFYEHPFSTTSDGAKGSFHVRNHFAHFLALGIGPMIWWLQHREPERGGRRSRAIRRRAGLLRAQTQASSLRSIALGVVLFAGLLSLSRGGMLVMFLAAAVSVAVCYRAKTLGTGFVLSLGSIAVLIGALLAIDGYDRVSGRLDELSNSIETVGAGEGRRTIWATVAKAIPDYALLGAGVGSHAEVYPIYFEKPQESEFTHAESGPLQVLLETGAIGLTLLLAGIGYCATWCVGGLLHARSSRTTVCVGAVLASLCVSVVHSTVDFVWYVPACTAIVAMLAGCACRTFQLAAVEAGREVQPVSLPRYVAIAMTVAVAVLGTWMIGNRIGPTLAEPHWDRYRIMAMAAEMPARPQDDEEAVLEPSPEESAEASQEEISRMISELEQVVHWNPQNGRAHLRLAVAYINQFNLAQQASQNAMGLAQIRDAAIQASFNCSEEDVERWITGVLGERRDYLDLALSHVHQGLSLCPLQGEGYLYLAELCFLEGANAAAAKSAYIDQALRVRSFDGAVLFEAGREAWLAGNYQQGIQYWQKSFRSGRSNQRQLIDMLAGRIPVSSFLEVFDPDVYALRILHARYRELDQPDELDRLRSHFASVAATKARKSEGKEAAKYWLEARWLYSLTDQPDYALQCAENAYQLDRNDYDVRHALGQCLAKMQRFGEAEEHFNWCRQRRPNDERLQMAARNAFKGRIDREGLEDYPNSAHDHNQVNYSDPTKRLLR